MSGPTFIAEYKETYLEERSLQIRFFLYDF